MKTTAQFRAGETALVVEQAGKQLRIQRADSRTVAFAPGRAPAAFEVGQTRELVVAAGDVLLLRANAPGFVNGERVQVKAIRRQRIALTDGRELPEDYRTFAHGYAVTSHAAQGKTVDEVLVVASSQSFAAVSQEQFYVSISRARDRARIFTDDAELLGRRVEDSHSRKAAVDLEGLREALAKAGFTRAPTVAPVMRPESRRAAIEQTIGRVVRRMRTLRAQRLAPAQRLAQQWTQTLRQWLGHRPGIEETQRVTQREAMTQQATQRQSRGIRM